NPQELYQASLELAASYLAAGIDIKKNTIFIQSHVPAHVELEWILTCQAPMGWLKRMTQFKDKSGKNPDSVFTGLFTYPVLMAADILLYHATHVPVGEDQKQHVELTRDLAISFNQKYGPVFTVPEPIIPKVGARIKSLRDGTKKMSKSDPSDMSRINLFDSADVIADKIKRAKTDMGVMPSLGEELKDRPEVENLLDIFAILSGQSREQVIAQFGGQPFSPFKNALAELLVDKITPIGQEMARLLQDKAELLRLLASGRDRAAAIATPTLGRVKEVMGFVASP
ncbi:MAG: trpS, partial [Alphaproteobacteria bacterium]|nr:trpS [Alphaproteobacteria bacterium]